ncbi:MAG: HD domain-containing protein [Chloroherpetonaceae bacterium]|nr:HD domain-containing protein [Chloroherpetonaceae bacterium]
MVSEKILHSAVQIAILKSLSELAYQKGLPIYAVGGFVRDIYLNRSCKDIDIMVIGEPIAFAEEARKLLNGWGFAVFERFRTARFITRDSVLGEINLEFVGARKESYNHDSRKPITEVGTLEDDLSRRDFTINALAISLSEENFGEVIDLFNGFSDLQNRRLKTPLDPKSTFSDDPLRMMRAARFASQLNFSIDPAALDAMSEMHERLKIVSQERVTDEFIKIMKSQVPSVGIDILYKTKLLGVFFPELPVMAGVEQVDGLGHKDTFYHTLKVLDNAAAMSDDLWLRMSALLHDIAKPKTKKFTPGRGWSFHGHDALGANMIPKVFRRMKFPMEHVDFVQKMVRLHLRPIPLSREEISDAAIRRLIFDAGEHLEQLMTLCKADVTSKNPKKVQRIISNFAKVQEKISQVREKDLLSQWRPPISGNDIMSLFNLPEGREVGLLKKAVENAIIDGLIPHEHDAAIEFVKERYRQMQLENSGEKKLPNQVAKSKGQS